MLALIFVLSVLSSVDVNIKLLRLVQGRLKTAKALEYTWNRKPSQRRTVFSGAVINYNVLFYYVQCTTLCTTMYHNVLQCTTLCTTMYHNVLHYVLQCTTMYLALGT